MVEKQASSEIAQSRFTWNDHAEEFLMEHYPNIRGKWRFLVPILGAFAEKVERDTRERCAQLGRSLLETVLDVTLNDLSKKNEILDTFERRIRGKE